MFQAWHHLAGERAFYIKEITPAPFKSFYCRKLFPLFMGENSLDLVHA